MNLLFIDLIALFMSHEQCNRRQTKKKKKRRTKQMQTPTRVNQTDLKS